MDSAAARFRRARGAVAFPKDDPFADFGGVVNAAARVSARGGRPQTTAVDVTAVDPTFSSPRRRALNPHARPPQGGLGAWPKDDALRPTTSEMGAPSGQASTLPATSETVMRGTPFTLSSVMPTRRPASAASEPCST